jgi:hypothetical protein
MSLHNVSVDTKTLVQAFPMPLGRKDVSLDSLAPKKVHPTLVQATPMLLGGEKDVSLDSLALKEGRSWLEKHEERLALPSPQDTARGKITGKTRGLSSRRTGPIPL